MNWENLKQDRCPRCGLKLLEAGMLDTVRMCSGSHCLFKIRIDRMMEIVSNVWKKEAKSYDPDKNLSDLNNLEL